MKDLDLMHYFLGLEVWQRSDEIFLLQGKYAVEIQKKFGMMDCKSMATPMISNLKTLNEAASDSNFVDPMMYIQLVGYGLRYFSSGEVMMHGYIDSDWEGSALIEESLQVVALAWVLLRFPGLARRRIL
jgi:hypothetical protein